MYKTIVLSILLLALTSANPIETNKMVAFDGATEDTNNGHRCNDGRIVLFLENGDVQRYVLGYQKTHT